VLEAEVLRMKSMWRLEVGWIHNYGCQVKLKTNCLTGSRKCVGTGRVGGSSGSRSSWVSVGWLLDRNGEGLSN
jgi:hypothetical protein